MNSGEKFKKLVGGNSGASAHDEVIRVLKNHDVGEKLTITNDKGESFTCAAFVGTFIGINDEEEDALTSVFGSLSVEDIVGSGKANAKATKEAFSRAVEENPSEVTASLLGMLINEMGDKIKEQDLGESFGDFLSKNQAFGPLEDLSSFMAKMIREDPEDEERPGKSSKTGTDDPFSK